MFRDLREDRKGVSPVIAVLLMVAIAVAASILVYVWSMGLIGTLTTGGGQQVREQVILEAYNWTKPTKLELYLRNVGNTEVTVDAVYLAGKQISSNMSSVLSVQGPPVQISITPPTGLTSGVAYTVKVVTKTGGVFTYSVICGSAG